MKDRLIKKLWHTNRKRFITEFSILQTVNSDGSVEHTYFEFHNKTRQLERLCSCHIVEVPCTGLRDKNGNLIYEGDIIVIPNHYPFYDYKNKEDMKQSLNETLGEIKGEIVLNYVGVVECIHNSWQYVYHCVNPKKTGISEGINYLLNENGIKENENSYFKVIGNIYENKEILKCIKS